MFRRRLSVLAVVVALLGLCIGWGYGQGQSQTRKVITPESLLPEDSVVLMRIEGATLYSEDFKKTAAYDALYKSGLMAALEKTFVRIKAQAGPLPIKPYLDAVKQIHDKGLSLAISPGVGEQGPQPWGIAVFHEGASLDKVVASLVQLGSGGELKPEKKTIEKRTISRLMVPDSPGVEIAWWVEGKHLALAFGINAANQAIAVAQGEGANVTQNPLWEKYSQSEQSKVTSFGWLNFVPVRALFGGMPVPTNSQEKQTTVQELLVVLGLDNLNSIGFQSGIKDRYLTSFTTIDAPGERRGLLSLLDQEAISLTDLPPLPKQLSSVVACSVDSAKVVQTLYQTAVDLEAVLSPETANVESARAQAKDVLGLDIIDDLLTGFGNVTCVYDDEAQTGFGIAPALIVEVQDAEKLNLALERLLVEMLPQVTQGKAKGVVKEKDGTKTYTIESPMLGVAPTISIGDQWFCTSFIPQPVMAFNLRQSGELPIWDSAALPMETVEAIPESFTSLAIVDPTSTYRLILGLAPLAAGGVQAALSAAQSQYSPDGSAPPEAPIVFHASDFPPAELVTKSVFPNVTYSVVDENGLTTKTSSSLPGMPLPGGNSGAVGVAVPAVLVALLLPAVQQAREAARRTQSKNNLKQIGLAVHNYADVFGSLPRGTVEHEELPVEERLSWMVSILPYVDQAPLYNQLDMKEGVMSEVNSPLLEGSIDVYVNPGLGPMGNMTHYVGIGGMTEEGPVVELPSKVAGIFGYDRATRFQDIQDGTSNTVMVAESQGYTGAWGQGGLSTIRPLTQQPYINGPDGIGGPSPGGCHFLLSDGSVRFISEYTDPTVLEALSTIQGGEVVNDF